MSASKLNIDTAFSADTLQRLWDAKLADSQSRGRDGVAPRRMSTTSVETLVAGASQRIMDGSHVFRPYRQVLRSKGAHKAPRIISIPTAEDRLVLLAISSYLRQAFSWIDHPRPQPLVVRVRQTLRANQYQDFVRLDVQNFYSSIAHVPLLSMLRMQEVPQSIVELVSRAICIPTLANGDNSAGAAANTVGVPVGTSLANVLGEISLSDVDATAKAQDSWAYFRYVDDILVLTKHGQRTAARKVIADELSRMGLKVHPKSAPGKSAFGKLARSNFDYLGYTFEPNVLSVSRARRTRLIDHLARSITAFQRGLEEGTDDPVALQERCQWWLNLRITGCYSAGSRRGWLPYYSQIDDMRVLHELDGVLRSFIRRLPLAWQFTPKSFVTAWTFLRNPSRDTENYVLDFDRHWTEPEMENALRQAGQRSEFPTGSQLRAAFSRLVVIAIKDLEHDVWALS